MTKENRSITAPPAPRPYDRRSLTYANIFDSPLRQAVIRSVEWMTGKARIVRMIRAFEAKGQQSGQAFW